MGEGEELWDTPPRKRKRFTFENEFLPTDKSEPPNKGDGRAPRKPRVGDNPHHALLAGLESPSRSFPSTPETETPTLMSSKSSQSCVTASTSPLFPKNSMYSNPFALFAPVPSPANEDNTAQNPREYVNHGDQPDSDIVRRLSQYSTTKDIMHNLKINLGPILIRRLKKLSEEKPTYDVGMEMADSTYLLRLLYPSNPNWKNGDEKSSQGGHAVAGRDDVGSRRSTCVELRYTVRICGLI